MLMEHGEVTAFAFHEPEKIPEVVKPSVEELVERATTDDQAWDNDDWWQRND